MGDLRCRVANRPVCKIDLTIFKSILFGDKPDYLRLPAHAHPMHSKNIFDAVNAYAAVGPGVACLDLKGIKMCIYSI
jgi:hypothetical protein